MDTNELYKELTGREFKSRPHHTPGPWYIALLARTVHLEALPGRQLIMSGNDAVYIVGTHQKANAVLISHAPEMVDLLRELVAGPDKPEYLEAVRERAKRILSEIEREGETK